MEAAGGQHEIPTSWTSCRVLPILADAGGTLRAPHLKRHLKRRRDGAEIGADAHLMTEAQKVIKRWHAKAAQLQAGWVNRPIAVP